MKGYLLKKNMTSSILLLSSCLKLIFGGFYKKFSYNKESLKSFFLISIVVSFFCILLNKEVELFSSFFNINNVHSNSFFFAILNSLVFIGSILILIVSYRSLKNFFSFFPEFFVIFSFYLIGAIVLISAQDIITAYISIEIQSLCLYLLAAFNKDSVFSTEAGIKYFVLGALASCFIVFGFSFIYMSCGSIFLGDFFSFSLFSDNPSFPWYVSCLAMAMIISGFLFKLALAPFHFWVADIYEGAPFVSSVFFASFSKIPFFFFFCKLLYSYFSTFISIWSFPIGLSAFCSIVLGTIGALYQTKFKRLLAYSGVVNSGLIFLGISSGTLEGLFSGCLCFIIYIFTSFTVWSFVAFLNKILLNNTSRIIFITEISSLFKLNTVLGFSLILIMFSLAGIPPLSGFFSKFYVFLSLMDSGSYALGFFSVLVACLSAFYYIRVIKIILIEKTNEWFSFLTYCPEGSFFSYSLIIFMLGFFFISPLLLKVSYFLAISMIF